MTRLPILCFALRLLLSFFCSTSRRDPLVIGTTLPLFSSLSLPYGAHTSTFSGIASATGHVGSDEGGNLGRHYCPSPPASTSPLAGGTAQQKCLLCSLLCSAFSSFFFPTTSKWDLLVMHAMFSRCANARGWLLVQNKIKIGSTTWKSSDQTETL